MKTMLKVSILSLATIVFLGMGSVVSFAHHDDANGNGVVYEGAGGR
jgi:hypothetical protein